MKNLPRRRYVDYAKRTWRTMCIFFLNAIHSTIRNNHLVRLALYLEKIQVNTDYLVNSEKDLLQLIIDFSASNLIDSQYRKDVDTIFRHMIYALHVKRAELLLE